ncbi:unnamed protein product [Effrenium voratum]|nr:unnamed protein product [Effrenium voratum]
MFTITRDLATLSRKLLEPLRSLADEMQSIARRPQRANVDPGLWAQLLHDSGSLVCLGHVAACDPLAHIQLSGECAKLGLGFGRHLLLEPRFAMLGRASLKPSYFELHAPTVLGLVGPASETGRILEQLYLCPAGSHALELDLGPVQCFYQRQDHVLFLCLDTSGCWTVPHDGEDCQYLLKCGNLELQNLMGLLLLFELCHVLLWLCPGQSPRLHADTLRALAKVKEVQAQYSKAENRFPPLVIFVHRELKLPFDQVGQQLFESLERVLDNRWRTCLKRLKLLQENKRGLLRVHRPCAVAMDSSPQVPKDLGLVKESWRSHGPPPQQAGGGAGGLQEGAQQLRRLAGLRRRAASPAPRLDVGTAAGGVGHSDRGGRGGGAAELVPGHLGVSGALLRLQHLAGRRHRRGLPRFRGQWQRGAARRAAQSCRADGAAEGDGALPTPRGGGDTEAL